MWPPEDIPAGPAAAFDIVENGALFHNEKENTLRLIKYRNANQDPQIVDYLLPLTLTSSHYYWARFTTITETPFRVMAVLKNHSTKSFEFFLLILREGVVDVIQEIKTQLKPFGYEVNMNRLAPAVVVVSFLSRKENKKFIKSRRSSDRQLFLQQVNKERLSASTSDSSNSDEHLPSRVSAQRTLSSHSESHISQNSLDIEKPKLENNFWSVMIKVSFPVFDRMDLTLVPFRKAKLSFKVRAPSLERPLPIKLNMLTRFSMDCEIRGPVIFKNRAYFLTKSDPPALLEAETRGEETVGYLPSFQGLRLTRLRKNGVPCVCSNTEGNCPSVADDAIWSNLQLLNGNLFMTAQNDSGQICAYTLVMNENKLVWNEQPIMDQLSDEHNIESMQIRVKEKVSNGHEAWYQLGIRVRANREKSTSSEQFFALARIKVPTPNHNGLAPN
ncbi:unnamed protein product, partial [Mesorhabditis spiculigera]